MKKENRRSYQKRAAALTVAICTTLCASSVYAMPTGGAVTAGDAKITNTSDKQMDITQSSQKAAIDWKGFDIAHGETVNFHQPDASAIALNRINSNKGSEIYGNLNANGKVFLINPNGVLFGQGAAINVGGLIASTKNITNADFMDGKYNFAGDSTQKVINNATIKAEGGVVALLANQVENNGTIDTKGGSTKLAAGNAFHVDYEGDGKINLTVNAAAVDAKVLNTGSINADGGYVYMTARDASNVLNTVVNNTGTIEAKSLKSVNGEIVLDGGDQGVVRVGGSIDASGDAAGQTGGNIKAIGAETQVTADARLKATGDQAGGLIETSGDVLDVDSNANIDASSVNGTAGEWLLDPEKVVIDTTQNITNAKTTNSTVGPITEKTESGTTTETGEQTTDGSGNASATNYHQYNRTSYISSDKINGMLDAGTNVTITSLDKNNVSSIEVAAPITTKYTGTDKAVVLTMNAQRDITVNSDITAQGTGKLDVNLHSDTDGDQLGAVVINANISTNGGSFTSGSGAAIQDGTVGTYFGNNASEITTQGITTKGGNINLYGDVAIGTGSTLTLDTTDSSDAAVKGNVTITGNVDSGNAYKVVKFEKGINGMTWETAKKAAEQGSSVNGTEVGDTYLATLTTSLENSVANAQNGAKSEELFVGGLIVSSTDATGKVVRKAYWVTGPESQGKDAVTVTVNKNQYQGTQFYEYDATGSKTTAPGYYAKWQAGEANNMDKDFSNNSQPYVAIGYGPNANWDDVQNNGGIVGYIKETNLANSALSIKAGKGDVTIGGNVGNSRALSNLQITNTGDVTIGGGKGYKQTTPYEGLVNVTSSAKTGDAYTGDVDILSEGKVTIGGAVTAAGNVNITGYKEVNTKAITATNGNVSLQAVENNGKYWGGDIKVYGDIYAGKDINISNDPHVKKGDGATGAARYISLYGNVTAKKGDVNVGADTRRPITFAAAGTISAEKAVKIDTQKDITVRDIHATGTINLRAAGGNDYYKGMDGSDMGTITLNGKLNTTLKDSNEAVVIATNGRFVNKAGTDAISMGDGSTWKIYSASPYTDDFGSDDKGYLDSNNDAVWNYSPFTGHYDWDGATGRTTYAASGDSANRYIFAYRPTITVTANDVSKAYGTTTTGNGVTYSNEMASAANQKLFKNTKGDVFNDVNDTSTTSAKYISALTVSSASNGFADTTKAAGTYGGDVVVNMKSSGISSNWTSKTDHTPLYYNKKNGYLVQARPGTLTVTAVPTTPTTTIDTDTSFEAVKPKLDLLSTANLAGSGDYGLAPGSNRVPGVERVAGLVSAELPFFKIADKQTYNYGTYDVTESPSEVKVEPTAKHLPEPNQPANQYRSLARSFDLTGGSGNFNLVYNGTVFNIYPSDDNAKALLAAGDPEHNVEIASKALYSSFNDMGLVLEDLDAIYIHTDATEDEAKA